jgi:sugar lactone lactonase YvrE
MTRLLAALVAAATLAATAAAGTTSAFPPRLDLPDGFQPEGIATAGQQFFVGSIPTGAVYRGSLRTGEGAILVPAHEGAAAVGLEVDRGRIFVSGGPTGKAFVYTAKSGAPITTYQLASDENTFVNDVVVTKRAAWFTDSFKPVLYRVPLGPSGRPGAQSEVQTVNLSGDYQHQPGFNLNGIDATANGKTLIVVQTATGKLFTVTPAGVTKAIVLAGGESLPNGDGILLHGKRLYVVQNQLNVVAKIALSPNLSSGEVQRKIGNSGFDVPTTIAEHGSRLYAVNARFSTPPDPATEYWVTQFGT